MGVVFLMVVTADDLLYIDFRMLLVGRLEKYKKNALPQMVFFVHGDECHGIKSEKKRKKNT